MPPGLVRQFGLQETEARCAGPSKKDGWKEARGTLMDTGGSEAEPCMVPRQSGPEKPSSFFYRPHNLPHLCSFGGILIIPLNWLDLLPPPLCCLLIWPLGLIGTEPPWFEFCHRLEALNYFVQICSLKSDHPSLFICTSTPTSQFIGWPQLGVSSAVDAGARP